VTDQPDGKSGLGAVIIGRNEGARLVACLASFPASVRPLVYVDSGSTDGSVAAAKAAGAEVVALDMSVPFTAARARNEGFQRLLQMGAPEFVQFVDGDCVVQPGISQHGLAVVVPQHDEAEGAAGHAVGGGQLVQGAERIGQERRVEGVELRQVRLAQRDGHRLTLPRARVMRRTGPARGQGGRRAYVTPRLWSGWGRDT